MRIRLLCHLTVSLGCRNVCDGLLLVGSQAVGIHSVMKHFAFHLPAPRKRSSVRVRASQLVRGADIPDISFPARAIVMYFQFSVHGYCLFPNGRMAMNFRAFFFTVVIEWDCRTTCSMVIQILHIQLIGGNGSLAHWVSIEEW